MWIWQKSDWPNFKYDIGRVFPVLEDTVRAITPLAILANELDENKKLELESKILLDEALATAKIEGDILDRESVRSSIANRLGIGESSGGSKSSRAFVDVLLESVRTADQVLNEKMLFKWHQMLFIEKPIFDEIIIGDYRTDTMQVISGRFGKQKVHFEAPCSTKKCVQQEMKLFLKWLEQSQDMSGYIKAAIAKFYFVTIHPFDDGNGRFSRIIAERCLATTENTNTRLYSLSGEIERNRKDYYLTLEHCQKGGLDITQWIIWFLTQISQAGNISMLKLQKIRQSALFWDKNRQIEFNQRQRKLITRLLETSDFDSGISRRKYKNLVGTTDITASRDLKDLLEKDVLIISGAGRSTKYTIRHSVQNGTKL